MNEPIAVAVRGRTPEKSIDRSNGINTKQYLEPNLRGCSNILTQVQKDNYIMEFIDDE